MNDPDRPIIDTRTMVTGERPAHAAGGAPVTSATPAVTPGGSVSSTPSVSTPATSSTPTTQTTKQNKARIGVIPEDVVIPPLNYDPRAGGKKAATDDNFKGGGNEELIDYLERKIQEHRPLSKEQLEKMRRRQRAQGIMSGISDAVQSVANLVFTNQYAPNMYNAAEGMSARARARFEREKAERAANDEKFFNYAMMRKKLLDADDDKVYQRVRDKFNDDIAAIKANYNARLADIKYRKLSQELTADEAAFEEWKASKEFRDKMNEAKYDETISRTNKNNRSGTGGGGGGRGGGGRHPWRDDKGVFGEPGKIYYESSSQGAQEMAAMHEGTYMTVDTNSTTTTDGYRGKETSTTTRSKSTKKKGHVDWED